MRRIAERLTYEDSWARGYPDECDKYLEHYTGGGLVRRPVSTDTRDQRPRTPSRLPPLAQPQLAQPQLAQPPSLGLLGLSRPVGMTPQPRPRYDPYDDRDRRPKQQRDADNLDDVVTHVRPTKS